MSSGETSQYVLFLVGEQILREVKSIGALVPDGMTLGSGTKYSTYASVWINARHHPNKTILRDLQSLADRYGYKQSKVEEDWGTTYTLERNIRGVSARVLLTIYNYTR